MLSKKEVVLISFAPYQGQQEVLVIPGGVADNVAGDK
jgi:hypothetical protein